MKYGVKYQNFLKGYYGVFLFEKRKQAERAFCELNVLWDTNFENEADYTESYAAALKGCIGDEESFSRKDLQVLNKDFVYSVNNGGRVSKETENMRLVFDGRYVLMPA